MSDIHQRGALALQAANSVRTEAAASAQAIMDVAARELDAAIRVRAEADQESETVRAQAAEHRSVLGQADLEEETP